MKELYQKKLKQLSIVRNEFDVHIDYIQQLYAKSERVKVYIEEKNNFVKQSLTNKSFLKFLTFLIIQLKNHLNN